MDATLTWAMVVGMGIYQGFDPAMGWLAAAGRGMQKRAARPVVGTVAAFALGHYLAMLSVLLPAALLLIWTTRQPRMHVGLVWPISATPLPFLAVALTIFGLVKLVRPRHPAWLARIRPDRRIRWSFAAAFLHCGSPVMMLLPFLALATPLATPLCGANGTAMLMLPLALLVPAVMVLPIFIVSGTVGLVVWRFLGLGALTRFWFDFDIGWGLMNLSMAWMAVTMTNGGMGMAHG